MPGKQSLRQKLSPNQLEDQIIIENLIRTRVQLRVLLFMRSANKIYEDYQKLFQKLHDLRSDPSTSQKVDRSTLISLIQDGSAPVSTFRADEKIKLLERHNLLVSEKEDESFLTYYDTPIFVWNSKPLIRPSHIADSLSEDLQSVISALNSLRRVPLKSKGVEVKLVMQKRASEGNAKFTGWLLLERGEVIAAKIISKLGAEVTEWDGICLELLKVRQESVAFKQKLNQLLSYIKKIQNEISYISAKN